MERQLRDLIPTRREVLQWGGAALAATWVDRLIWPLNVRAQGRANPRGTARNCIFIEMGGAISPMECWDFKETRFTPRDLDVEQVSSELSLSRRLFPTLIDKMDQVSLVRSMWSPERIHFQGQYHTQAGRALNPAVAKEIPAFGSVIATELDPRRRDTDRFPTYVSTGLTRARAGSIGSGLFPAQFTALDLDPTTVFEAFRGNREGVDTLLDERWTLLGELAEVSAAQRASLGEKTSDYRTFYREAYGLLNDPRWATVFNTSEAERERYGGDEYGLGLILAKNVLAADAGTHFVYVYDGDKWDHHSYIFDHDRYPRNHYFTCNRFDKGITSLLDDLASMPGVEEGKTMLDETLIVAASEFGRTPAMNAVRGRDHYGDTYTTFFAGGGVKGGRIIGKTNENCSKCIDTGWEHFEQPAMDNTVASIYSALGIDWLKSIEDTPSGRSYDYVDAFGLAQSQPIATDEIAELFE